MKSKIMEFLLLIAVLVAGLGLVFYVRIREDKIFLEGQKPLSFKGLLDKRLSRSELAGQGAKIHQQRINQKTSTPALDAEEPHEKEPKQGDKSNDLEPFDTDGKPKTIIKC